MSDYKHILLAVDFSAHGNDVALRAKELSKHYQSKLSLVHVVDSVPFIDTGFETILPFDNDLNSLFMKTAKEKLDHLIKELDICCVNQWLELGSPKTEIIRIAVENEVDLIVVGSNGRHGFELLLGSTANSILHHAPCDVLAVRIKDD